MTYNNTIKLLLLFSAVIFLGCQRQATPPPIPAQVEASSYQKGFRPASLLDDSPNTGWQPSPIGKYEILKIDLAQPAYIDTLSLKWNSSHFIPSSTRIYADRKFLGTLAPEAEMALNDSIQELWIVPEFPVRQVCVQPESKNDFCLLRQGDAAPAFLSKLQGLECDPHLKAEKRFSKKINEELKLPFFRGVRENKGELGVALHSLGRFSGHEAEAVYLGHWTMLGDGKIQVSGKSALSPNTFEDTLSFEWEKSGMDTATRRKALSWKQRRIPEHLHDSSFVAVRQLGDFEYDLRYAADNNFMDEAVYPCGDCWLRYEAAQSLLRAQETLKAQGYDLLLFDCYRPLSVQKKMWEVYPNPSYVANPYEGIGSIHNRGGAVDLTVIDQKGEMLDMGTTYDYFGVEAHQDNFDLPEDVLKNRALLREAMVEAGFRTIRTEWWHYSYQNKTKFRVADIDIECPNP